MPDVKDMDLILEYVTCDSEPAFAELVHRHINLVYSVALRYVSNSHDAQDVTQAVFIILAEKPRACAKEPRSPGGCMKPRGSPPPGFCEARPDNKPANRRLMCNPA